MRKVMKISSLAIIIIADLRWRYKTQESTSRFDLAACLPRSVYLCIGIYRGAVINKGMGVKDKKK